jgi:hypothetical protein
MGDSRMRTRRWKIWVAVVAIVAAVGSVPFTLVVWLVCRDAIVIYLHQRDFDDKIWRNQEKFARNDAWPPRLCMVDDLLAGGRLNGMTRSQVIELLGPPDSPGIERHGFSYYLGPERGFIRIDSETLIVEFGVEGTVSRARIYRD